MELVHFRSDNPDVNVAYYTAMSDLIANIKPYHGGILPEEKEVIIAGIGYYTPWTRDASINTLNAGDYLFPEISKNTLESVLKEENRKLYIGGEYWDAIIWAWGAWEYYRYTKDADFLKKAYEATVNSLAFFEATEFDAEKNLFRGAACYGDGVAAYPDIYTVPGNSGIIAFARERKDLCAKQGVGLPMMALSTNCLYYKAYVVADQMAAELGKPQQFAEKAWKMKEAINQHFWMEEQGRYRYLLDPFGGCDSMEGMGNAFVVQFGIADEAQTQKVLENQHITVCGIPCVWPSFSRYDSKDGMSFGRHSGTIWPHIQSFWADAALHHGRSDLFDLEFKNLTAWSVRDGHFAEIYHPITSEIYGGVQEDWQSNRIRLWKSEHKQTWSATGYLHMIFVDILGLQIDGDQISFSPYLPEGITSLEVSGLLIRGKRYRVHITGAGKNTKAEVSILK